MWIVWDCCFSSSYSLLLSSRFLMRWQLCLCSPMIELKKLVSFMYVSLQEMVLNTFIRHIISINLASKKAPKLGEPYLWNRLRYIPINLHVKFFNGMYQHIQKWRKSKMFISQFFLKSGDFVWNYSDVKYKNY